MRDNPLNCYLENRKNGVRDRFFLFFYRLSQKTWFLDSVLENQDNFKTCLNFSDSSHLLPEAIYNRSKQQKGRFYYYKFDKDSGEKSLGTEERALIADLIQRDYLEHALEIAKHELSALKKMKKIYPDTIIDTLINEHFR